MGVLMATGQEQWRYRWPPLLSFSPVFQIFPNVGLSHL